MTTDNKPFKVGVLWGTEQYREEHAGEMDPDVFEFATQAELNAFTRGVAEGSQHIDYVFVQQNSDGSWPKGEVDLCLAGNPAVDGTCGDEDCVCARVEKISREEAIALFSDPAYLIYDNFAAIPEQYRSHVRMVESVVGEDDQSEAPARLYVVKP